MVQKTSLLFLSSSPTEPLCNKSFNLVFVFNFFSICTAMAESFANYMERWGQ